MKSISIGPLTISFQWRDAEWQRIARMGAPYYISAIKEYRASFPKNKMPGLRESKDAVDDYLFKRGLRNRQGEWL